jgi:predicted aspartyl protease
LSTNIDCFLSLNAISGTQDNKVIHLIALVNNQVLSILIDSGSSHTFLNASMLTRLSCVAAPVHNMRVRAANGQTVMSNMVVRGLEWWIQGYAFQVNARVLNLAAYDLILGMDWLEQHNHMTCDWLKKLI